MEIICFFLFSNMDILFYQCLSLCRNENNVNNASLVYVSGNHFHNEPVSMYDTHFYPYTAPMPFHLGDHLGIKAAQMNIFLQYDIGGKARYICHSWKKNPFGHFISLRHIGDITPSNRFLN